MKFFRSSKASGDDLPRRRRSVESPRERPSESDLAQRYAFRMGRTITGSSSSAIRSSGETGAQLQSSRVQAHHLTRLRRRLLLVFGVVVVAVAALFVLVTQFTAVAKPHVSELSRQLDPRYERAIQNYFGQRPLDRLRFIEDDEALSRYVAAAHPEVASVKQQGSAGIGATSYLLTMRRPVASWMIGGTKEYVDANGVSFTRNFYDEPNIEIVDKSGIHLQTGKAVASQSFLGFVGQLVGTASKEGYTVTQVIIPASTTHQVEIRCRGVGYPVKFIVDRPAGEQVADMAQAIAWMKRHHKTPKYIDVQVSGRVFYK